MHAKQVTMLMTDSSIQITQALSWTLCAEDTDQLVRADLDKQSCQGGRDT